MYKYLQIRFLYTLYSLTFVTHKLNGSQREKKIYNINEIVFQPTEYNRYRKILQCRNMYKWENNLEIERNKDR